MGSNIGGGSVRRGGIGGGGGRGGGTVMIFGIPLTLKCQKFDPQSCAFL